MTGRRVVLLPGMDGTTTLLEPFLAASPAGFDVEAVAVPNESLAYSDIAERLSSQLRLSATTVLVAESFSGPVGVILAARHRIAALVLCNSFIRPPVPSAPRRLSSPLLFRVRPPSSALRRFLVGADASDEMIARVREALRAAPASVLASRLANVLSVDVTADIARCTAPLLYLRGTEDRLVGERSVAAVVSAAPGVVVERIHGPHLLLQAQPQLAWKVIEAFLARRVAVAS